MATNLQVERPQISARPRASSTERDSDFIDLTRIWAAFRRRKYLFLLVALIVFAAALAAYFLTTPKYASTATVRVQTAQQRVVDVEQVVTPETPDTYAVDTEVQVLQSPTLAARVVDKLRLYRDPEFIGTQPGMTLDQKRLVATYALLSNLVVSRSGFAFTINITYTSPVPATAQRVANAMAEEYIQMQLDDKLKATQQATKWLNDRLAGLRGQVLAADAAVQRYRAATGLLDTSNGNTIAQQEISALNSQLASAEAERAGTEARLATARSQLQRGSNGEDVGEALGSPVVSQLRQQRAEVSRTVADLQGRYGQRHPELLKAQRQLADIDDQIKFEIRRVISNLDAQAQVSRGRAASVQASLNRSRGALAANSEASVKMNELERNAESVRTLYESYLTRFKQTSSQQGIERPDSSIVTAGGFPVQPVSPNLLLFLAIGVIGGLAAGTGAVAFRELVDVGVRSAADVEERLGQRPLGSVPELASTLEPQERKLIGKMRTDVVVERPFSAFAESFRMMLASLTNPLTGKPYQVVAITSALPGEGKTTTAICLARIAAISGSRAVLVECDTRRATSGASATRGEVGLLEVLSGQATIDQALQVDEASGAFLLPLSQNALTPANVLTSPAMDKLIDDLRRHFDLVVLDTAPVLPIAETRVLAAKADAVAFLVRWGRTPYHAAAVALRFLAEAGANLAGVTLTVVDLREQSKWARGDAEAYFDKYRKYYT